MRKYIVIISIFIISVIIPGLTIILVKYYGQTKLVFGITTIFTIIILSGIYLLFIKLIKNEFDSYRNLLSTLLDSDRRKKISLESLTAAENTQWTNTIYGISNKIYNLEKENISSAEKIQELKRLNIDIENKMFNNITVIEENFFAFRSVVNKLEKIFIELIGIIDNNESQQHYIKSTLDFFSKQNAIMTNLCASSVNEQEKICVSIENLYNIIGDLKIKIKSLINSFTDTSKRIKKSINNIGQLHILMKNLQVELNKDDNTNEAVLSIIVSVKELINELRDFEFNENLPGIPDCEKTINKLERSVNKIKNVFNQIIQQHAELNSIITAHNKIYSEDLSYNYVLGKDSAASQKIKILSQYIIEYREQLDNAVEFVEKLK